MLTGLSKCLFFLHQGALNVRLAIFVTLLATSLSASALSIGPDISSLGSAISTVTPLDGNKISLRAKNMGDDYANLEVYYAGKLLGVMYISNVVSQEQLLKLRDSFINQKVIVTTDYTGTGSIDHIIIVK